MNNINNIPPSHLFTSINIDTNPPPVIVVDADRVASLILPIFSGLNANMDVMQSAPINPESARSINTDEANPSQSVDESKKKGESDSAPEPMPETSKDASKDKIDILARFIANIVPEKLARMLLALSQPQSSTQPNQPSKDDQSAAEQAQKDPENSNMAVPKESIKAAADQPSYNKSQSEYSLSNKLERVNNKPENSEASVKNPLVGKHESKQTRDSNQPQTNAQIAEEQINQNVSQFQPVDENKSPHPSHAKSSLQRRDNEASKMEDHEADRKPAATASSLHVNEQIGQAKGLEPGFFIKDLGMSIYEPNRNTPNENNNKKSSTSHELSEVKGEKQVSPRKDVIVNVDKNESPSIKQLYKFVDESLVARMPIMPDFPLSREAILRQAETPKNSRLKEDEGFRLGDLVLMLLCSALSGAKNTLEVCRYLLSKEKFFKVWMGLKNNMPTYRMLWFLLNRLDPSHLEKLLQEAIGKRSSRLAQSVNIWESNRGLVLGELTPLVHSRNPSFLLEAIDLIDIYGAVVNVDASTLSIAAARKVKLSGGEYIFNLKGGHGRSYEQAQEFFEEILTQRDQKFPVDNYRDITKEGSSTIIREVITTSEFSWFEEYEDWPYLQSAAKLMSQSVAGHKIAMENRIYLSSLPMQADKIAQTLRILSVINGQVDWLADCDFLFQSSKDFHENESMNMEILSNFSTEILINDKTDNCSIEVKRKKVKEGTEYLRNLLQSCYAA